MRCVSLALLAVIALVAPCTPGTAEPVSKWESPVNYPARVVAVIWDQTSLDADNPVRFGAWTVRLEPGRAYIARHGEAPFGSLITIGSVNAAESPRCSNVIEGERSCYFHFEFGPGGSKPGCLLMTYKGSGAGNVSESRDFPIPCPTALDLER